MKHCLYLHQDYQPPKLSQYPLHRISCEYTHFSQVLYAKWNELHAHFSTDEICRPTGDFHGTCSHLQITSPKNLTE